MHTIAARDELGIRSRTQISYSDTGGAGTSRFVCRVGGENAGDRWVEMEGFHAGLGEPCLGEPIVKFPAGPGGGVSGGAGAMGPPGRSSPRSSLSCSVGLGQNPIEFNHVLPVEPDVISEGCGVAEMGVNR